jgi:hypothetical protein
MPCILKIDFLDAVDPRPLLRQVSDNGQILNYAFGVDFATCYPKLGVHRDRPGVSNQIIPKMVAHGFLSESQKFLGR